MLVFYYKDTFILTLKMLVDCSYALVPGEIGKKKFTGSGGSSRETSSAQVVINRLDDIAVLLKSFFVHYFVILQ